MVLERRDKQNGFTLLELMIVVAIIGILAMIAIPRFAQMLEKAREGATKGNLSALRSAISIYYGDWEGKWPGTLDCNEWYAFSLYMDILPAVKVTAPESVTYSPEGDDIYYLERNDEPTEEGYGWAYDSTTGNVFVNSTALDTRQEPYTTYGL